jgi:hypothetical protein
MANEPDVKSELKPVSKAESATQKFLSEAVVFVGACSVALGAYGVFKIRNPDKIESQTRSVIKALSVGSIGVGALSALVGALGVRTANAASRARTFVQREQLTQELDSGNGKER